MLRSLKLPQGLLGEPAKLAIGGQAKMARPGAIEGYLQGLHVRPETWVNAAAQAGLEGNCHARVIEKAPCSAPKTGRPGTWRQRNLTLRPWLAYVAHVSRLRLLLCCSLMSVSCGYSLHQAASMPLGVRRVFVPQAYDSSPTFAAASVLTESFRERIASSPVVEDVPAPQAEAVLELTLESVSDNLSPTLAVAAGQPAPPPKFGLRMVGKLRMFDHHGKVVWQSESVAVNEDYLAGAPSSSLVGNEAVLRGTEDNRRRALERAATALAGELYGRLVEGF